MYQHYIYKITNKINGKIYIGKHSTKNIDDGYFGSGVAIRRAISKYGVESFDKTIVCFCETEGELSNMEISWIRELKSFESGYNMTKGGEGKLGLVVSEKSKKKQSESMIKYYKDNPEAKIKISERGKRNIGSKNGFFGKKLSKDHVKKMTAARIKAITGVNNPSARAVRCIETGEVFSLSQDAAKACGLKYSTTILKAAKGQRKKAGGFTWELV